MPVKVLIDREIQLQAAMAGYNADFLFLAIASLVGLPLLLLIGRPHKPKPGEAVEPPESIVIGE